MKLNPQDLEKVGDLTLDHHNEPAGVFVRWMRGCSFGSKAEGAFSKFANSRHLASRALPSRKQELRGAQNLFFSR
jgi:hypothetical protein